MPASQLKLDVAQRQRRTHPPAQEQKPAPHAPAPLPPATAAPAAARAGELVAKPATGPDPAARAQLSVALQQNVGNARMAALVAPPAQPESRKEAAKEVPKEGAKETPKEGAKEAPKHTAKEGGKGAPKAAGKGGAATTDEKKGADSKQKGAPSAKQALGPAIAAVHNRAGKTRKHSPAGGVVANAQAAGVSPKTEQARGAAVQTVANIDAAPAEKVKRDAFRTKLREAIDAATPKPQTESEADHLMKSGAGKANNTLRGALGSERDAAAGPLKGASQTEVPPSSEAAPPKSELQPEAVGPPPAPVSAGPVVPTPLPPERLDYSSDRGSTDQAMQENNISKEQLAKGNEPAFKQTIDARSTAEQHEATAEAKYRKDESGVRDQTHKVAAGALAGGLGGMFNMRSLHVGRVGGQQNTTKEKNAQERQRITDTITGFKTTTKGEVDKILASMETEAARIFEEALGAAEKAYVDTFEDEKGGLGTWLTTWGSSWERLIERSLKKAREEYLRQVGIGIDRVADLVDSSLDAAKKRVADGRKQVEDFVKGLDKSVAAFGEEAMKNVSADFDAMSTEIDARGDKLVETLTAQYKASYERMSAKEEALREANKSLWQRVYDATVGLIKKIIAFKDMLVSVLKKAADVIVDIISDPIGFLGNLVGGVMNGLTNFKNNLGKHLKKGLMEWIFGELAGAGLQLPDEFDLKGIISIALQVLGLTYANFRKRAVAIVGEEVVSALETVADIFKIIATEGIAGLWRFIKEKVEDVKSMVLDAIFDFIKEKVIIAGVTWIIGLLNPASAFFKACKAIYDIIKFFVERGSQILALINAIIDSIAAIAKGQLATAAKWVEEALAKAIPVAIGFLASLLGLGDVGGTVKKTIEKAQTPVNNAIDWAIGMAVKGVKALGKFLTSGKKKEEPKKADEKQDQIQQTGDPTHDAKVAAGLEAIDQEENNVAPDTRPTREQAVAIAKRVRELHPVFTAIEVVDEGDRWRYDLTASKHKKHGHTISAAAKKAIKQLQVISGVQGVDKLIKALGWNLKPAQLQGYLFQAERTLLWHKKGVLKYIELDLGFLSATRDERSVFDIVIEETGIEGNDNGTKTLIFIDTKSWNEATRLGQQVLSTRAGTTANDDARRELEKWVSWMAKRLDKYRRLGIKVVIEWKGAVPQAILELRKPASKTVYGSIDISEIP